MADVVSKTNPSTGVLYSVNTPNYPEADWFINPVLPPGPSKYWKNEDGVLVEMSPAEKVAVDEAEASAYDSQLRVAFDPVESLFVSQTTHGTFQTKLVLVTQDLPIGTYHLTGSWKVWVPRVATKFEVCVAEDATILMKQQNNTPGDILGNFSRTFPALSGVHTYLLQWRRVSGFGDVRISDAVFNMRKVA